MHGTWIVLVLAAVPTPRSWSFKTTATPRVIASNVRGPIEVVGTAGDEVKVEATITGGTPAEQAEWAFEVDGQSDRVSARVCCGPCGRVRLRDCPPEVMVKLRLEVPAASRLEVHEVSGSAAVQRVRGPLALDAVSGPLSVEGSEGRIEVKTVSGDVTLSPGRMAEMELHSVSGNFHIKLPVAAGAKIEMHTVSGSLDGRRVGIGTEERIVGGGGPTLQVHTVSGSVETGG